MAVKKKSMIFGEEVEKYGVFLLNTENDLGQRFDTDEDLEKFLDTLKDEDLDKYRSFGMWKKKDEQGNI